MTLKRIIMLFALALQVSCGSKDDGTKEDVKEIQVILPNGSTQTLKYSLNQTSDRVSFKMDISRSSCSHYSVEFKKSDIEPTYQRETTVEDLGDILVKSSYFKDEFSDSYFSFNIHQYRYIYFVADESVNKNCVLGTSNSIHTISQNGLELKINTLPSLSKEMNLSPEYAAVMAGSANYLTYYISLKIGDNDNVRVILKSDDLSVVGVAVHTPILGYEDMRNDYLLRFKEQWDAPEAMPLLFFDKDFFRYRLKKEFMSRISDSITVLSKSYSKDYLITLVKKESQDFGGKQ